MVTYIDVTVGLIEQDGKILIAQRPLHKPFPGLWEFPGGKFEPGERPEECLKREIKEELNIDVTIARPFLVWEYDYKISNKLPFRFHGFWCTIAGGELIRREHEKIAWVAFTELAGYDFLEADKGIIEKIQDEKRTA